MPWNLEPGGWHIPLIIGAVRLLILVAGGYLLSIGLNRLFDAMKSVTLRFMSQGGAPSDVELEKRANTIVTVVRKPAVFLLWAAVVMVGLQELGFRVEPLLAGAGISAGIIGVAVGFGAQSLIKDMIAGIFMLAENQIRVGDVAVINGTSGSVEEINLRTIVLRSENGAVHIFPNGSITTLANLTQSFAYHVVEVTVPFEQDVDQAAGLLRTIAREMREDDGFGPMILGDLDVWGLDKFVPSGLVIKGRLKTLAGKQWPVGREFNRRLRECLTRQGMEQPAQVTVLKLEGTVAGAPGPGRDEIKELIREVLAEVRAGGTGTSTLPRK